MPNPVLVIGRSGQLAQACSEVAQEQGHPLIALGRSDLDLASPDAPLRAMIDHLMPCAVINAAAYTAVDQAEREPEAAFSLNRDGPARLAKVCAQTGVPLIHVSTEQVFDGEKAEGGYGEEEATAPLCIYGLSKREGENAVLHAHPTALVVRTSWVFGATGSNFVTKMIACARAGKPVRVVCDQRGRPTYAPALAGALLEIATKPHKASGFLHLAGSTVLTREAQARLIMESLATYGMPSVSIVASTSNEVPSPARRPRNGELDISRAAAQDRNLGSFIDALEATLTRLAVHPTKGSRS